MKDNPHESLKTVLIFEWIKRQPAEHFQWVHLQFNEVSLKPRGICFISCLMYTYSKSNKNQVDELSPKLDPVEILEFFQNLFVPPWTNF